MKELNMKKATVGIPRALFYWKKPFFWPVFFENLGFKVLLSPQTNKEIIETGVKAADSETCFSVKVFYGHTLWLEGKVDFIFIPRLKRSELKLEYCPKFFALPDLFSLLVKTPILSPWIDMKNSNLENILIKFGKKIGKEKELVEKAIKIAISKEKEEKLKITKDYLRKIQSQKRKIVIVSHPYNLYDEYVNLRIRKKIIDLGGEAIFIDEVPYNRSRSTPIEDADIRRETSALSQRIYSPCFAGEAGQRQSASTIKFHWEFGQEMLAQIKEVVETGISGAIEISAFQCGCDAVLKEFVEKEFKQKKIPFLYLLIDEHTAEAGFQTRLEAFFDTLH